MPVYPIQFSTADTFSSQVSSDFRETPAVFEARSSRLALTCALSDGSPTLSLVDQPVC